MNQLISVIVPVYKVEPYLEQCINSITCQSYKNLEVILVDDGSPDKSGELADQLAASDSRLKVIHKKNGGLSSARNAGLEAANGEYVMFMDSDDFWMDNTCLERLTEEIEKTPGCDFIGFNCNYYYAVDGKDVYTPWVPYDENILLEKDKEKLIIKLVQTGTFPMSACLKIIKRNFLQSNNIEFKDGIIAEDIPWFLEMLRASSQFRMVNDYIYAYRQTSAGSITHTFSLKGYNDLFNTVKSEIPLIKQSELAQDTKDALLSFIAYEWCILLGGLKKIKDRDTRVKIRRELYDFKWLLDFTMNPKVYKVRLLSNIMGLIFTEFALAFYLKSK